MGTCAAGENPPTHCPCLVVPTVRSLSVVQKKAETTPPLKLKPEGLRHMFTVDISHPESTLLALTSAWMGDHLAPPGAGRHGSPALATMVSKPAAPKPQPQQKTPERVPWGVAIPQRQTSSTPHPALPHRPLLLTRAETEPHQEPEPQLPPQGQRGGGQAHHLPVAPGLGGEEDTVKGNGA